MARCYRHSARNRVSGFCLGNLANPIYIYIYIYIVCMCVCIYIYIYTHVSTMFAASPSPTMEATKVVAPKARPPLWRRPKAASIAEGEAATIAKTYTYISNVSIFLYIVLILIFHIYMYRMRSIKEKPHPV